MDSDMDTGSRSEYEESEEGFNEEEWKQIEDDIHRLSELQTEAYERMRALTARLSSLEPNEAVLSMIQQCHQESLQELEETGEVTFGQRLLVSLCTDNELKQE